MLTAGLALALTLAQAQAPLREAPKTDETVTVQRGSRLTINNFAGEVVIVTGAASATPAVQWLQHAFEA